MNKDLELIKEALTLLNCNWESRVKLVDAVKNVEAELAELAKRRELDSPPPPLKATD